MNDYIPGTLTNELNLPIVELYQGDTQYECPWSVCGETIRVPTSGLKGGYTCPVCHNPVELHMEGSVFRTAARPVKHEKTTQTLYDALGQPSNLSEQLRELIVLQRSLPSLHELWENPLGQVYLRQNLEYFSIGEGRNVPPHQRVEKAIVGAQRMLERGAQADANQRQVHRRGQSEETIGFGLEGLD